MNSRILFRYHLLLRGSRRPFCSSRRPLNPKIPAKPIWRTEVDPCPSQISKEPVVDEQTIQRLERLALVDFNNIAGIQRMTEAIKLADQIQLVDTTSVKPMDSVLEDRTLYLRDDEVTEGNSAEEIMKNSAKTCEEYFVAPTGNIPLPLQPVARYGDPHFSGKQEES